MADGPIISKSVLSDWRKTEQRRKENSVLDYLVIYESETGNTKKIATEIFSALPGMSKDLINIRERETLPDARIWFVGFCVHMGTCPMKTGSLLASLSGKAVALFGTCGAGNSPDYYKHIEASSRIWLEDDNLYLGAYFCQGKMPLQVRQKYEARLQNSEEADAGLIQRQLRNFDEAMIHPSPADCAGAREFALSVIKF